MATLDSKLVGVIGDRTAKVLRELYGYITIGDLLHHYPRRYLVRGELSNISELQEDEEGFEGAYVKEPIPGKYNWVYDLDMQSLYPSIMMQNNISPECIVGMIDLNIDDFLAGRHKGLVPENCIVSALIS